MNPTTFTERPGTQPARARVVVCGAPSVRRFATFAPAAVGLRLIDGAYHSWQPNGTGVDLAKGAPTAFATLTMSTKRHTRTLGTRTT